MTYTGIIILGHKDKIEINEAAERVAMVSQDDHQPSGMCRAVITVLAREQHVTIPISSIGPVFCVTLWQYGNGVTLPTSGNHDMLIITLD